MSVTGFAGPLFQFGASAEAYADYNPDRSPSLFDQGLGIMDPRQPFHFEPGQQGSGFSQQAYGWYGNEWIDNIGQVPSTASTTTIAAAQAPSAGTPLTLVTSTGGGITVGVSITRADTGVVVSGLLAIDGAMGYVQNGSSGGSLIYSPATSIARTLQCHSVGNDQSGTLTIRGFDIYNFPVTETLTLTNGGTATSQKALKYVYSLTPGGTLSGSNISVGQSDTYGFSIRSDLFQKIQIWWPDTTLIASPTGYTAAVTTSPATATTGDVRGTYALQGSGSNNTRRLVVTTRVSATNVANATALVGVTQYADF